MTRVVSMIVLVVAALAAPLVAEAQPAGHVFRLGWLESAAQGTPTLRANALLQGLRDLGYVEGRNLVIEFRSANGRWERLPDLAGELVRLKVDLIVTVVTPSARAAKAATSTIPIVMVNVSDPVASGLVASLARPGGNVTGLTSMAPELSAKPLEVLREMIPGLSRVGVLWNPNPTGAGPLHWGNTQAAGQAMGVALQSVGVQDPRGLSEAFATMTRERAQAIVVLPDPILFQNRVEIVRLAARHRLPAVYEFRHFVDAGGLMSYGTNLTDLFRRAATYVDKILKGAKPADLPVEQPTKFELVINLKTAKALGLTIPPSVLARADEVIQ